MNEIDIKPTSKEIKVNSKKINSKFTRAMAMDLSMMYDINEEIEQQLKIVNREKIIDELLNGEN